MFERFTDNARKTMALANQEAHRLGHDTIGVQHIVLALLKNRDCTALAMLSHTGVDTTRLRARAEAVQPAQSRGALGALTGVSKLGQTPEAKRVVELAINEARDHGHGYVGTEHMLAGVVRIEAAPWPQIWQESGMDVSKLWEAWGALTKEREETPHRWTLALELGRESDGAEGAQQPATRAPEPVGAYPTARRVGNLLFLSGQGPRQRGSKDIPGVVLGPDGAMISYDVAAQVRAVFQNIRFVLEEHGSSMARIVDVTCFLTDLDKDFAAYNRAYAELFPPGPNQPCRTTIGIHRLPQGGNAPIAFEAKVIATVD